METDLDDGGLTPLHPDHKTVLRIIAALASLPPLAVAIGVEASGNLPFGVIVIPIVLICAWFVLGMPLRRYMAKGYAMGADRLRVVRGVLFRKDTVVPFGRVQHIDVEQGPLERHFGLATLVLHTAGNHNASVSLPGLSHEDAVAMRETIRAHIKRETM